MKKKKRKKEVHVKTENKKVQPGIGRSQEKRKKLSWKLKSKGCGKMEERGYFPAIGPHNMETMRGQEEKLFHQSRPSTACYTDT